MAVTDPAERFIMISTQGKGDEVAMRAVLNVEAVYKAFVGSKKKRASIREKLSKEGASPEQLYAVKAPAGLSILSEITSIRRKSARTS